MPLPFLSDLSPANVKELMAAIAGITTFAYGAFSFGRTFGNRADKQKIAHLINDAKTLNDQLDAYSSRAKELSSLAHDNRDFWLRPPAGSIDTTKHQGELSQSIPIISVINFKGGVGKTTICANLAAQFASAGKRVLLIDFDYQGSLSDIVLSHARTQHFTYTSHHLISHDKSAEEVRGLVERVMKVNDNLWIYPAFYFLNRVELQIIFRWLNGETQEFRYNLHNYLQSRCFQSAFDIVIIDCAPRLLTAAANALAASTHVLVPTILDEQSRTATLNTLGLINSFRQVINKNLKTIGVVPSLVASPTGYSKRELNAIDELERQICQFHDVIPVLKERSIYRKEVLSRIGGSKVVYLSTREDPELKIVRTMFDRLAAYIEPKLDWKHSEISSSNVLPGTYNENRRVASRV